MMDELLEEMIDPEPSRQDAARRRRAWATGSILVLAAIGVTSLTTSALFTDQDSLTGTISTGTIVLTADGAQFTMPVGGLAPGGTVVAPVTLSNVGSLELRYAVSLSAATTTPGAGTAGTGDLRDQLRARVLADATCTLTSAETAPVLGDTQTLVGTEFGQPATMTPIVGDPATGNQTGDRVLAGVTGAETLCVRVDMSRDADNTYQNTAAELTFQFDSEQTVNN
ncbi:TasA family protein [Cellulomonas sp. S1-8]|uniref:TasA family protein n=1 Tax=Cellulomonas sp. S1-8 TaxID=2904790 RepID=UPI0022436D40|nr:TasA family protein [Cellulomonas sp. S1-8]UZN02488.1 CalY family protein [Cellulomonas sp. S1-8]